MSTGQRHTEGEPEAHDPAENPSAPAIAKDKSLAAVEATKPLANDMKEAKDMALHVIERLEAASSHVVASELESAALVGARVGDIAQDFGAFLNKFRGEKTVFRLVHNREVMAKIHDFHEDIDKALGGLGVSSDTSVWRKRWEGYREAHCEAFEKISRSRVDLMGDIRGDTQAQSQALAYLLYEYNKVTSKYTEKELKVLNNAFNEVSKFSNNKVSTITTWFLPPYTFEYISTPFAWGAFGTVHRGKYEGANVIVKRVKITSEASRAAFFKEANTWYTANAIPNVVRLYGAYHLGSEPYFVSEYAANGTLSDFLLNDENRRKTWKLLHDAAKGLRALHRQKILHNDLKCDNILVMSDIVAKLIDFGLSAQLFVLDAKSARKPEGAFRWKAPEVLSGATPASKASDVYSLAMCIYEAVTHLKPYHRVDDVVIPSHIKEGILPTRPEGAFTNDQWQLIVDMAALDPDKRISMDEVVKRLEKFEEDEFNSPHMTLSNTPEESNDSENQCDSRAEEDAKTATRPAPDNQVDHCPDSSRPSGDEYQVHVRPSPVESVTPQTKVVIDAKLSGFETVSSGMRGVEYVFALPTRDGEEIRIRRRYSDLRYLRKILKSRYRDQMKNSPPFPSRKPFWTRDLDAIARERQERLANFVAFVISHEELPVGIKYGNNEPLCTLGANPDNLRYGGVVM